MPPNLALVFCSGFVLFLLWLERKQSPGVTRALWIPTLWMLYTASKPLGVWFPSQGADPDLGSPLDRALLIVLLCIALWVLVQRRFDWRIAMEENIWVMVLVILMLISILWSSIPAISFKRWIRELQAVLMAFVVLSESSPRQAIECILRRSIYILIPFSLLLIKYFPWYGVEYGRWTGAYMWIGVTLQKNGLGRLCLIAIFYLVWTLVRRWRGRNPSVWKYQTYVEVFVLFIALWLIKGPGISAYSATAVSALAVGLLVYLGLIVMERYRRRVGAGILTAIAVMIIAFGIVAVNSGGSNVRFLTSSVGRDATITGRTEVWAELWPVVMQRPLLGRGFGGFWIPRIKEVYRINEGHSGYLDLLLDLGFAGILFVSLFILSAIRKAQKELSHDYEWGTLCICFFIMAMVHNISESSINTFTSHLTAVILFLSISLSNITPHRQQS